MKKMKINILKYGILIFLSILTLSVFYSVFKSTKAEEVAETTNIKTDSIKNQVDYRYTSFDNLFFQKHAVVIDTTGNIIGEIFIYTNNKEINDFYSDSLKRKTQFYKNLKNGSLKIKIKDND